MPEPCTAFVVLASRYYQNKFRTNDLNILFKAAENDKVSDNKDVYNIVKNIEGVSWILPFDTNTDKYDEILDKLFSLMIKYGTSHFTIVSQHSNEALVASNYLKKDKNYIDIISGSWDLIAEDIKNIFDGLQHK